MAPAAASTSASSSKAVWKPTKIMNMRDLSRDDDFLSHLLVEKLGTGDVPLVVHKMDPSRKLPKTNADDLLEIVRRMVAAKGAQQTVIRQAVDDLLTLNGVKYFLKSSGYDQKQINAFATHASRYFELYLPNGSIEIAHTSRYSHQTGKSELCILATRPLAPGTVISELKGSMADLTEEEDKELKRTGERHADGAGIRRDFSVIHSRQLKKNHLFLGPARFVNHDCDHNVELFREGRYITFRVIKPIAVGEEVTAHYGPGYFGRKNRHCLCATCERNGRGGYAPQGAEEDLSDTGSGSSQEDGIDDDESSSQADDSTDESDAETINCNERRTRRGVYAVMPEGVSIELDKEADAEAASDLTSLPTSQSSIPSPAVIDHGLMTPEPEGEPRGRTLRKGKGRETPSAPIAPVPRKASDSASVATAPYRSIISTRSQKGREASLDASSSTATSRAPSKTVTGRSVSAARQLITPPLTNDSAATSVRSSSRRRSAGDTLSSLTGSSRLSTPVKDKKGKGRATTTSISDVRDIESHEPEARHLRPRVSAPIFDSTLSKKKLVDAPRGLDGKPLPMCSTCGNVLPVIAVDSEIVWGLTVGRTGKRGRPKKDATTDCPRCLRHFAIYGRKWPERIPGDGRTFTPIQPMFSMQAKKITHSALAAVNKKLTSTTAHNRKRLVEHDEENTRPTKKQRSTFVPRRPTMAEKAKQTVQEMRAFKEMVDGRRSGRTRVPSLKLREREPHAPATRVSPRRYPPSTSSLSAVPDSPDPPPALPASPTTPTGITPVSPKNITPKSLAVAAQPRDANGRFGKKASTNGRFVRKQFTVRKRFAMGHTMNPRPTAMKPVITTLVEDDNADDDEDCENDPSSDLASGGIEHVEFGEEALEDVVLKRSSDTSDLDDSPRKKARMSESDASDASPSFTPRFAMGRGSLLRPNPISFARRKWAADGDETTGPSSLGKTSDTQLAPAAVITSRSSDTERDEVDAQAGSDASPRLTNSLVRAAKLTYKPSPMNFAKRRWAPSDIAEGTSSRQSSLRREAKPTGLVDSEESDISAQRSGPASKPLSASLEYPCEENDSDEYYTTDEDYSSSEESDGPVLTTFAPMQPSARPPMLYRAPYFSYGDSDLEANGYPMTRARSPIYRPASFHISRPTTPHLGLSSPVSPLTSPESVIETHPHLTRVPTPEPVGEATSDSSERLVERLLGVSSAASTSLASSATPPTPLTLHGRPETSPGAAWKDIVLNPTDSRASRIRDLSKNVSFPIPSTDYPYDPRSRHFSSITQPSLPHLPTVHTVPLHPYISAPATPPRIVAPQARSPIKFFPAGWSTPSDTDSP